MSSQEFTDWVAYFRLEPWYAPEADYWGSLFCAILANCHRGKDGKKWKPEELLPSFLHPEPDPSLTRDKFILWAKMLKASTAAKPAPRTKKPSKTPVS